MAALQKPLVCAPQESIFLSVPGEIRNYIYSFCVEPVNAVPGFGEADLSTTSSTHGLYSKPNYGLSSDCWNTEHGVYLQPSATQVDYYFAGRSKQPRTYSKLRQFFGLTQVCRQVRLEYAPVYRRALHVNVWFPDLPAFINTFYPLDQSKDSMLGYEGKITIQVPWAVKSWIDLTPLLKLCRCGPLVQVNFDSPFVKTKIINDLNRLSSPSSPQPHVKRSGTWYCVGTERVRYPGLHSVHIRLLDASCHLNWDSVMKLIFDEKDYREWMSAPGWRGFTFGGGHEWTQANAIAPKRHLEEVTAVAKKLELTDCESCWFVVTDIDGVLD